MKHKTFVTILYQSPSRIEPKFRSVFREFSLGHGRIDIIGRDTKGTLCLVEVKTRDSEIKQAKEQVKMYQRQLVKFLSLVGIQLPIRGIAISPNRKLDVGTRKSAPIPIMARPTEIPTTREIYGLIK